MVRLAAYYFAMTFKKTPNSILAIALFAHTVGAVEAPDFNREVRPILSNNCFKCHGPDDKARKSKLRLDVREEALKPAKSGEHAIMPGKVDERDRKSVV